MLSHYREKIRELEPLKSMLVTVSEQCDQKILKIREGVRFYLFAVYFTLQKFILYILTGTSRNYRIKTPKNGITTTHR